MEWHNCFITRWDRVSYYKLIFHWCQKGYHPIHHKDLIVCRVN